MSNERPDDFLSWRRTLSRPDALPEHGLEDREISWEKLAERLRDKPRRRWTGYWIAAACLLLALIPVARLFRDHPRAGSPRPTALRPTTLDPTALRPAAPQKTAPPVFISRNNTLPRRTAVSIPARLTSLPGPGAPPAPATPPRSTTLPRPANIPTVPVTTPVGPLTASLDILPAAGSSLPPAKPKRQLRVVNINEITRGASPAPATAGREPGFLRIGTTIPTPPGSSSTDDPALIKIKLSQNR